jgi:hypothetical protein
MVLVASVDEALPAALQLDAAVERARASCSPVRTAALRRAGYVAGEDEKAPSRHGFARFSRSAPAATASRPRNYAGDNHAGTLEILATADIAADAHIVTDGHAGYSAMSLGTRPH